MTDAQGESRQQHDISVSYADEVITGEIIDDALWESWSYADAGREHYYAKGPCPTCFAEAQGHAADTWAPLEGQGPGEPGADSEKIAPSATIEIPVRCQCGFGHGKQDATGCGRAWSVIVARATS
jgi:hypothetical protein